MRLALFALLFLASPCMIFAADFELKSNDMVVFVGNTFTERAQRYGHIETAMELAAGPEITGLRFRNLGWSGDSVFGDARSYFGEPKEGRDRLDKGVAELKPQVILLCYGTGAAMTPGRSWTLDKTAAPRIRADESAAGLTVFIEGYSAMIDRIKGAAGESLREIVLVSPPPLENLGPPLPDQKENNQRLATFRDAIGELAAAKGARFLDLFGAMGGDDFSGEIANPPLTDNGIHYGSAGYLRLAAHIVAGLGMKAPEGLVGNEAAGKSAAELRKTVIGKNRLFFHRWRPANETYLFLFRKHEQGNNAKEIPMFDPLIAKEEGKIGEQRKAVFEALKKR